MLGICAGPLWSAKSAYITTSATRYANATNQKDDVVITRFFGIFFMIFQCSNVVGNFISSQALDHGCRSLVNMI